jgi:riboflavin biosynthesis pyrimidine reductase
VTDLIVVCGGKHPITTEKTLPKNCRLITQTRFNREELLHQLHQLKIKKVTIQSAGKLNAKWVNEGLIDYLTVIVYPLLVGSSGTSSLVGHKKSIPRPLRLLSVHPFNLNYISLNYQVIND